MFDLVPGTAFQPQPALVYKKLANAGLCTGKKCYEVQIRNIFT